ncbi:galactose-1-phosphate uridylyltransferase [Actinopolymorpha singaporensis]|uniref:Galactose-1-phosphate uridylyltransferase n=1 Tax=Actinopolymorpha singaporensis TaxID=117157 RepID=A0A1H1SKS7_9ACTN|nr:galactose-1-phosphate uridylyltransferase [Actinopolymorpha singaporensis]SDS48531.1 UDPglucose--hexose-1-phosphate uridylyltransferase [Actinopolymorpha singaporensis]
MKKTATRLADGRELIYFDESDSAVRDAVDQRDLPPRPPASELRYDPLVDEWVAIAAHRQGRTFLPPADQCPLCPSRPGRPSEIPAESYDVVVFENRFPSFAGGPEVAGSAGVGGLTGEADLFARRQGVGRCEVVCFTSEHGGAFGSLSPSRVRTVVEAWADRTADLSSLPGVEQVFCFENRGEEIGVTLHHPHGQIYGYPFVPPRTRQMLASARAYAERTGGNLFADVLAAERAAQVRVVAQTRHWTAFVPAAARWPVEVHLHPHRRVPDLAALNDAERAEFGPLYLRVLRALDRYFAPEGGPDLPLPYIAAWHQAPVHTDRDLAALHLQVFSIRRAANKLKYLAGSESGMGVWINDGRPEDVAARLRALADEGGRG